MTDTKKTLVAPSILSADFGKLREEIEAIENAGADWVHIDVMDGHFVPNITIGPLVVAAARNCTSLPLDVHLMIEEPDRYITQFAEVGADIITVHQEACPHLHRTVHLIKSLGKKVGVSLNPATPVSVLEEIVGDLDMVLLMSVNPGFGGQSFITSSLEKAAFLREMVEDQGYELRIEMDGGIKPENAAEVRAAGVDVLVAGSAIFGSDNYSASVTAIRG